MSELSLSPAERARNAHGAVLSALQAPGSQVAIAATLGASEATVSRIKNERLSECLAFLYAAGFKVVPQDCVSVSDVRLHALAAIAHSAMKDAESIVDWVKEGA